MMDDMSDDLLHEIASLLPPRAALRLSATTSEMRQRLESVRAEVEASGRMFLTTAASDLRVSNSGAAIEAAAGGTWKAAVVSHPSLPTTGRSTFSVDVLRCQGGYVHVGVVDAADCSTAWALAGYSGSALKLCWDVDCGHLSAGGAVTWSARHDEHFRDVQCDGVLLDANGRACTIKRLLKERETQGRGRAQARPWLWYGSAKDNTRTPSRASPSPSEEGPLATIDVVIDHDEGTLSFGVNGGPATSCLVQGLPAGAALKPIVSLYDKGDRVAVRGWACA